MKKIQIRRKTLSELSMESQLVLESESRTIVGGGDYYNKYTGQYVGTDGIDDHKIYETPNLEMSPRSELVGTVVGASLSYDGGLLSKGASAGVMRLFHHCSNGKIYSRMDMGAETAPRSSIAHHGRYMVSNSPVFVGYGVELIPLDVQAKRAKIVSASNKLTRDEIGLSASPEKQSEFNRLVNEMVDYAGSLYIDVDIQIY